MIGNEPVAANFNVDSPELESAAPSMTEVAAEDRPFVSPASGTLYGALFVAWSETDDGTDADNDNGSEADMGIGSEADNGVDADNGFDIGEAKAGDENSRHANATQAPERRVAGPSRR